MRRILPVLTLTLCILCLLPLCARAGSGEISGYAFVDKSGGVFDANGRVISGVPVSLYRLSADGAETRVAQARTGSDGAYAFTGLDAGQYRLYATLPDNYLFTQPHADGSVMLPASGTESFSLPIDVSDGQRIGNAHIGASVGGRANRRASSRRLRSPPDSERTGERARAGGNRKSPRCL